GAGAVMGGVKHRNAQVVGKRQARERPRQLEAARKSAVRALMRREAVHGVAVEVHAALLVLQGAADAIDQCALAGAVRADQAQPLAGIHLEIDAVERDEAAEAFADILHAEEGRHLRLRACRRSCTSPTMPFGAMMTKAISSTPTSNTFTADEMVTVVTCCRVPSRIVPISGPTQLVVPPISGMAMELTAYSSPNAETGAR